jgi:hypothetical protein
VDRLNPIYVFVSAFGVSSFAGLAALLRGGKQVTIIAVLSAVLNSGLLGLAIALVWYNKFQDNVYFLIGIQIGGLSVGLNAKGEPEGKGADGTH